jgi:hypothetical protein
MADQNVEIRLYNADGNVVDDDDESVVRAEKYVNGNLTFYSNEKDSNGDWIWKAQEGGRKRRSFKKYKKGGNKHTNTMGGRKSKKSKKSGKKSKTRRH